MLLGNLLEIPEITHLICSRLDNRDLATCVRVSKGWHNLFLSYLWRKIVLRTDKNGIHQPCSSDIYHHRHLIHDLTLQDGPPEYENFQYPNLRKLKITCGHPQRRDISLDIANMFPSLVHLSLNRMNLTAGIWSTLSGHPRCKSLVLEDCKVEGESQSGFWRACTGLESLTVIAVSVPERNVPAGIEFPKLSYLWVWNMVAWDSVSELGLFLRCPRLKVMSWHTPFSAADPIRRQVSKLVQKNQWPHLESLCLEDGFQDTDLAAIIEGAGSLSRINIGRPELGEESFKQLGHFFSTLTRVDLEYCLSLTSSMIRDMLCGCPRLETLKVTDIHARDIAQGGPWSCQQLRHLVICIVFHELEQDLHQVVFERLSTLVRLECLELSYPCEDKPDHRGLQFRLDRGMGQLASLRQLRDICYISNRYSGPQIGKEEVNWILDNWKSLARMRGSLNENMALNNEVKEELRRQGISTSRSHTVLYCEPESESGSGPEISELEAP
ncbi:hypothetical protein B0O80DRAFT_493171 [Mortierella sp. GBAus27b]|nr:hypothetical protein BGX31_002101 [Mortierella sp. GBA43]KAI8362153.1 hypothetical protein B0O80DRAFT_493171 [Mortierella sp. GBAus27b]